MQKNSFEKCLLDNINRFEVEKKTKSFEAISKFLSPTKK